MLVVDRTRTAALVRARLGIASRRITIVGPIPVVVLFRVVDTFARPAALPLRARLVAVSVVVVASGFVTTPGVVDARVVPTRVVPTRRLLARRAARSERAETEVELDIVFVVPGHHHGDDVDRLERVGRTGVVPAFRVELRPREDAARAPDLYAPAVILVLPAELVLE